MSLLLIGTLTKDLKNFIGKNFQLIAEPDFFNAFLKSEDSETHYYIIFNNDLPLFRDLKAFLNMLNSIEKIALHLAAPTSIKDLVLFKKFGILKNIIELRKNYKIYSATNNIFMHYLSYIQTIIRADFYPVIKAKIELLLKLCTKENLENASLFFKEQLLTLEKFKENYEYKKNNPVTTLREPNKAPNEDFMTFIIKQMDSLLRKIYKDKFKDYFSLEETFENKNKETLDENLGFYYQENKNDNETVKHLKFFMNGIISIKKVLNDHEAYRQASFVGRAAWMSSFFTNLRRAYQSFMAFDHEAIIAERSTPLTEEIKTQLQKFHEVIEKLTCVLEKTELELHLKPGLLLNLFQVIITHYNQITYELRIPVDYIQQRHGFITARLCAQYEKLIEMGNDIDKILEFLPFKNQALAEIDYPILENLYVYLSQNSDKICIPKPNLEIYLDYLVKASKSKRDLKNFILDQFEVTANFLSLTYHAEIMQALENKFAYLLTQYAYLHQKFMQLYTEYQAQPYQYFNLKELKSENSHRYLLTELNKYINDLCLEEKMLQEKEQKLIPSFPKIKYQLQNQLHLKKDEVELFTALRSNLEEAKTIPFFSTKKTLSAKSSIFLKEMEQIFCEDFKPPNENKVANLSA